MSLLTLVQGDTAPDITSVLHEESDSSQLIDLTGASVRFQMRLPDAKRYQVNALAEVISELGGQVSYSWGENDLSVPGTYNVQWQITYPGGRIQTTAPEVQITVRRQ